MTGRPLHLRPKRVSSRDSASSLSSDRSASRSRSNSPNMTRTDNHSPVTKGSGHTVSAPLNAEPSRPQERRKQGMSPKPYASAAKENLAEASESQKHQDASELSASTSTAGEHDTQQNAGKKRRKKSKGGSKDLSPAKKDSASIGGSGTGVDSNASKPSQTSQKRTQPNGQVVTEKISDRNGQHLTSIKPPPEYEEELRLDRKEMKQVPSSAPIKQPKTRQVNLHGKQADGGAAGTVNKKPPSSEQHTELVSGRKAASGWERSGIRWAPLNVPLKRRLQTLAVLAHALSIATLLSLFLFGCAIPLFWPILFPYTIYILLSSEGSSGSLARRSERLRSARFWSLFASYFPARLHRSQELEPTRKYIFGYHPHGIISHGAFSAFATEALGFSQLFPGITNTLLTLDSNFRIPFYRDYALAMGLRSVDRVSIENLLSKGGINGEGMGRAVTIVVGGARESLDAEPGRMRLVLRRRKGFVKLAVKCGADLVPVLGFGENELYEQVDAQRHPWVHRTQLLIKRFVGFTVPLFHARGVFNYDVGLMPYRRPLNVVVGKPIPVEQMRQPSEEYVNELHARYVDELERLWEEWHTTFASTVKGGLELVE